MLLNSLRKMYFMIKNLHDFVDFFFSLQNAAVAFSALVRALDELKVVAVVRYAYDRRSNPQVGVAFPYIKDAYEVILVSYPSAERPRSSTVCQNFCSICFP